MAKIKIFSPSALRKELIKTGWEYNIRHKYTSECIGCIHVLPWQPIDQKSPFFPPTWNIRSKWTSAQQHSFQTKLEAEKLRLLTVCSQLAKDWFQSYHPELTVNCRVDNNLLYVEAVNASTFSIAQQAVAPRPNVDDELLELMKQIRLSS